MIYKQLAAYTGIVEFIDSGAGDQQTAFNFNSPNNIARM